MDRILGDELIPRSSDRQGASRRKNVHKQHLTVRLEKRLGWFRLQPELGHIVGQTNYCETTQIIVKNDRMLCFTNDRMPIGGDGEVVSAVKDMIRPAFEKQLHCVRQAIPAGAQTKHLSNFFLAATS